MSDYRDTWSSGDTYEPYVGRWSRLVARDFLGWLSAPDDLRWLDVGCGTGALTETIVSRCSPDAVVGVDQSEEYLAYARARVTDPRVSFRAGDAQALPVKDGEHDAVVSGLVLNFVPDQALAVSEMRRALSTGGTAAAYVWDYAGEMQLMRRFWDAAVALDSGCAHGGQRGAPRDRRPHGLQGLRRLLVAVPRRSGAGARVLHVAQRGAPRCPP